MAWRVRIIVDGRRKSCGLYDTEHEAEQVLEALRVKFGQRAPLTLRTWGKQWLDARETDGAHRGVHVERSTWRTHVLTAPFADWPLRRIEAIHVRRWVKELARKPAPGGLQTLAPSTVKGALSLLRMALREALEDGHADHNAAHGVQAPKMAKRDDVWTWLRPAELVAIADADLRPDQRAIFTVAIYTGMRAGELWGLRWCDVQLDCERPAVHVRRSYRGPTKSGHVRWVPLLPAAAAALRAWRRHAPGLGAALVFPARGGGCHATSYHAGWRDKGGKGGGPGVASRVLGRRVRFHDLRHTCASHLVQGTWTARPLSLDAVRQWLGHTTTTQTARYAHLAPDYLLSMEDILGTEAKMAHGID